MRRIFSAAVGRISASAAAALLLSSSAALAEICEDLWFTRNMVMHRAGYCFSSNLGVAIFGNEGCRSKFVTLEQSEKRFVSRMRRLEKMNRCGIDGNKSTLALRDLKIRRQMVDLPLRDEFESGCIGWKDVKAPLYDGHKPGAEAVGWIEPGDNVNFSHVSVGEWSYVTVYDDGWKVLKSGGWTKDAAFNDKSCSALAG